MLQYPVAVINRSDMEDADVRLITQALDAQVQKDFAPAWGVSASVSFVDRGHRPQPGKFWLVFIGNSDQAEALGFHDLTPDGQPLGKVPVWTATVLGEKVSTTASSELLEMLADPYINLTTQVSQKLYAHDICTPCGSSQFAYTISHEGNDVPVSNFVHPRYFDATAQNVRFDQGEHMVEPFQILAGGYLGVWTPNEGWQQLQASQVAPGDRPRVGSRRERRRTPRDQWMVSDINAQYREGDSPTPLGSLPEGEEMITVN